ncbi:hypothetical protein ACLQ28_18405 [Micromonospora sp. DT201]|uniref:hypothetical protein n=1 Tax=Micromonospora sp. DT201 TaxID=3393442 RepID=UPI003CF18338
MADGRERLDLLDYEDLSVRASLATVVSALRSDNEVAGRLLALLGAASDALRQPERVARQLGIPGARLRRTLEDLAAAPTVAAHPTTGWRVDPVAA